MFKHIKTILLAVIACFSFFCVVLAQSDGTMPPDASATTSTSSAMATPKEATSSVSTSTKPDVATTSAPKVVVPKPKVSPKPILATTTVSSTESIPPRDDSGSNLLVRVVQLLIVAIPCGFLINYLFKRKEKKEEHGKCFDIKQMLDKKLEELTDVRGRIESEAKKKIRENIVDAAQGTKVGEMLAIAEKAEKEYERLKKLYEECMIEFGGRTFRGTIVENSLTDKSILDKLILEKTTQVDDWVVHDVSVPESQIPELSKHIADGPWYIHLWEKGKDDVTVIFKDKVFHIKSSDKSTWKEAVEYGKSIGIKEDQLDFPVK